MRARLREALDADLDIAVRAFSGTKSDRRLWASIAWRVGIEEFHHALLNKLAEDSSDSAPRSPAAAFQAADAMARHSELGGDFRLAGSAGPFQEDGLVSRRTCVDHR